MVLALKWFLVLKWGLFGELVRKSKHFVEQPSLQLKYCIKRLTKNETQTLNIPL